VGKIIVFDSVVTAAAEVGAVGVDSEKDVAAHGVAAGKVVEVNGVHPVAFAAAGADVVDEVFLNPVTPAGKFASGVNGTGIIGIAADVVDVVAGDPVEVAIDLHGHVGRVGNMVVGKLVTDPVDPGGAAVGVVALAVIVEAVAGDDVVSRLEFLAITAFDDDGGFSDVMKSTIFHPVVAAVHEEAGVAAGGKGAIGEGDVAGVCVHFDQSGAAVGKGEAFETNVLSGAEVEQGLFEEGENHGFEVGGKAGPKVKLLLFGIEVPFAGLVEFFGQIIDAEGSVFFGAELWFATGLEGAVNDLYRPMIVSPVRAPVAMRPEVFAALPERCFFIGNGNAPISQFAVSPVAGFYEVPVLGAVGGFIAIGPGSNGGPFEAEKNFTGGGASVVEAVKHAFSEVLDSGCGEIEHPDMVAGCFREAITQRVVLGQRSPIGCLEELAAGEDHFRSASGPDFQGGSWIAPEPIDDHRFFQTVKPLSEHDFGNLCGTFAALKGFPEAVQRLAGTSRAGVVPVECDVKGGRTGGKAECAGGKDEQGAQYPQGGQHAVDLRRKKSRHGNNIRCGGPAFAVAAR